MAVGSVLVVGGGIAGLQASLDLADSGFKVYLVDRAPALGGRMAQLDKTFPTNDCSICILSPKLVEVGRHPNIEILSLSVLEDLEGEPGDFVAHVLRFPRFVREELCTGCGTCVEKCPGKAPSEFDERLGLRKAIYIPYPQAIPRIPVIDPSVCTYFLRGKCRVCEKVCPKGAIDYEQKETRIQLPVGAVILAPGYRLIEERLSQYGYGRFKNVLTSLQYERLLSASGPTRGEILRPSDGKVPRKIAWIQCVGSRNHQRDKDYCSSVCCMYAIKEAIITREHNSDIEGSVFFIDIRAFGKGFDLYYERAKKEYGIRFVRSMIGELREDPETQDLIIRYVDEDGKVKEESFGLLVLSLGIRPDEETIEMARRLKIELDPYGFVKTSLYDPLSTSRPGVFVAGAFEAPKDIPESVAQASGAAARASFLIAPSRWKEIKVISFPEERDISGEEPKIGVFICHCGINIAGVVNIEEVVNFTSQLPQVVHVEHNLFTCAQDTQERIKEVIREKGINRVVVAACSPRTHEPLFQQTIREAGLNPYLFEMANIRDQCSWIHMKDREKATEKAKQLVKMAVNAVKYKRPLKKELVPVKKRGLVIGGGLAGLTAALGLAQAGFEVFLVEKESELGGNLKDLYYTLSGEDPRRLLEDLIKKVTNHPRIQVILNAQVVDHSGFQGNFSTGIVVGPSMTYRKLEHGITILCTGAEEYKPKEYLYGKTDKVLTQLELEKRLGRGELEVENLKQVVMIQCVGSRNEERPYCSRICCQIALKNALKLKEVNPNVKVLVLYRDMRTYGLLEPYYRKAREKGVIFERYEAERPPEVWEEEDGLRVRFWDEVIKRFVVLRADLVVLSCAIVPRENEELATMFKVPRTLEGFYQEAHLKLRPVDTATEGVYISGLAHWPKLIEETIAQSLAAVSRASRVLSRDHIEVGGIVAKVKGELCAACLLCVRACPYGIPYINEDGVSVIDPAKCRGCGNCVAVCPQKAIELQGVSDEEIFAKIEALGGF
jgi:heterodisulfide reductase subunit A